MNTKTWLNESFRETFSGVDDVRRPHLTTRPPDAGVIFLRVVVREQNGLRTLLYEETRIENCQVKH